MEAKKNPILRKLIIYQLLAVITGVSVLSFAVLFITRTNYNHEISNLRQKIQDNLSEQQEKWRTWKQLRLDDALKEDLASISNIFPIRSIEIIPPSALPKKIGAEEIILPQDGKSHQDNDLVLFAKIDTSKIKAAYFPYRSYFILLIGAGLLFIFITLVSALYIYRSVHRPISRLNQAFDSLNDGNDFYVDHIESTGEIRQFISSVKKMHEQVKEHEGKVALAKIADQVVHDIRSPLSVIDSTVSIIRSIPEDKRNLMNTSISRIKGILRNLDVQNQLPVLPTLASTPTPQLLTELVQLIISAKRAEYRRKVEIEIEEDLQRSDYIFFANVHPTEFDRVVSNLINNSIEAIEGSGRIVVSLQVKNDCATLKISDSGKGIEPENLPKLMKRGATIGKEKGKGLGLFHAKSSVEDWGGRLEIESAIGLGTTVTISLPRAKEPEWFTKNIQLPLLSSIVVVLDDDSSIHEIWKARFRTVSLPVQLVHFTHPHELRQWYFSNPTLSEKAVFLNDFEIRNAEETGLDLVEELHIGLRSLLVTSRFEDENIRTRCERIGAKMIPKNYAGFIPIIAEHIALNDLAPSQEGIKEPVLI